MCGHRRQHSNRKESVRASRTSQAGHQRVKKDRNGFQSDKQVIHPNEEQGRMLDVFTKDRLPQEEDE